MSVCRLQGRDQEEGLSLDEIQFIPRKQGWYKM